MSVADSLADIVGDAGLVSDPAAARPFLTDERRLYSGRAAAIVMPATTAELSAVVQFCYDQNISMVPQGGNTGYCGGATPDDSGAQVLIGLGRLNRLREIDVTEGTLCADSGMTLAVAQNAAHEVGWLLPLSMGSEGSCQLGGNVSTNAGGIAVLRYGTAREMVGGLEVVLPDGRIWSDLKGLRKDNTGYDLKQMFMGAEGTLGIISAVKLRLSARPRVLMTGWVAVDGLDAAVALLGWLRESFGDAVSSFEFMTSDTLTYMKQHSGTLASPTDHDAADAVLFEIGAFEDADDPTTRERLEHGLSGLIEAGEIIDAVLAVNHRQRDEFWHRRSFIPEMERAIGGSIKHDISVKRSDMAAFVNRSMTAIDKEVPQCRYSVYGHIGDGNLHFNVLPPVGCAPNEFAAAHTALINRCVYAVVDELDGSFSAEHGVGQLKRGLLLTHTDSIGLSIMRDLKAVLDPKGLMNPGKVV